MNRGRVDPAIGMVECGLEVLFVSPCVFLLADCRCVVLFSVRLSVLLVY